MPYLRILSSQAVLITALFCLPTIIFSQIKIEGVLLLGDTTQVLKLTTNNGDEFRGYISSWGEGDLKFRIGTGDLLVYKIEELESVVVMNELGYDRETDLATGEHLFKWAGGNGKGRLLVLTQKAARIKYNGKRRKYLKADFLRSAELVPGEKYWKYPNNYILRLKNGKKVNGHLLSIDHEYIGIQEPGGLPLLFRRSAMNSLKYKKSYQAMTGHERALILAPTGFGLRKKDIEFRNINYILNSFAFGLSDHLTATVGLFGYEPYVQLKAAFDLGSYIHTSVSWGVAASGARGWSTAVSVGTPDYYLNIGFMANKGELIDERTDMDAVFFGASMRLGNRMRAVGEVTHIIERKNLFEINGFGTNTFSGGVGWFSRRLSLNIGLMFFENNNRFCGRGFFAPACDRDTLYYGFAPILSTSIKLGKKYKRVNSNKY